MWKSIGRKMRSARRARGAGDGQAAAAGEPWPEWVAWEPALVPPLAMMRDEGITVLEEWFRWAEEWSVFLRVYGRATAESAVVEIGCGTGRIAFPLRYVLSRGTYDGFDIRAEPIEFLRRTFQAAHPNFRFHWADVHNTFYNPRGRLATPEHRIPVADASTDLVFAASIFTHMLPENTAHYFREAARVLRPGGRAVFSFFLLDHYRPGEPRHPGFARPDFDFDHAHGGHGGDFAVAFPGNPERMTAYRLGLLRRFAEEAGLALEGDPVPGLWSGTVAAAVGAQDLLVLRKE
jgi:SAM-dependent methyltransferase